MKTWIVPVLLIVLVLSGGFIIWIAEGTPTQSNALYQNQTPYQTPSVYREPSVSPAPTEPVDSFIKITSPTDGSDFIQGNNYNLIKWQGDALGYVDVLLTNMSGTVGYIYSHNVASGSTSTAIYWSAQTVSPTQYMGSTENVQPGFYNVVIINPTTGVSSTVPITIIVPSQTKRY